MARTPDPMPPPTTATRHSWWERAASWVSDAALSGPSAALEVTGIAAALGGSTALLYRVGGAPHTVVNLFYFPIIYAAARFGRRGGVAAAVAGGLLAGPLMPRDVAAGTAQPVPTWLLRLIMFVAIAVVVQWLARQEPRPLRESLRDVVWGLLLRQALRRGRVTVHYQPIVRLTTGTTVGVEALCRWPNGRGGYHPPAEYIPAAEHNGTIGHLGRTVLARTAAQAAAWSADPHQRRMVTVNISAVQLSSPGFLAELAQLVVANQLAAELFCLEITESALIREPDLARGTLRAAHAMGLKIAIDDFGTGHSSLAYLNEFPIDFIKIDRSFVADVDHDPKANSLTMAIIELAKALGAEAIAEGIERESQLESLRALGCPLGQGWLLGRPVPAEQIPARASRALVVPNETEAAAGTVPTQPRTQRS